ncbi:hypothetical protein DWB77_03786 [Streptomyces hundungensis]|uniref:Uncharacterized protein n=1 Tax=Streptomyces hundungensis TaxID=1077946 RepID=A0A387HCS4_9ACTN|nr:hypothetical protein [Streptomyces hundungensis]AYG81625.1 hypothetical protein DWB77_03786 [Streptomyces hundungensis]
MSSPYINAPVRARMYATKQHKVIWIVATVHAATLDTDWKADQ